MCACGAEANEVWIRTPIGICCKWACTGHVDVEVTRLAQEWGQAKNVGRPICKDDKLSVR